MFVSVPMEEGEEERMSSYVRVTTVRRSNDCLRSKPRSKHVKVPTKLLFIITEHSMRIFGICPFFKLQANEDSHVVFCLCLGVYFVIKINSLLFSLSLV